MLVTTKKQQVIESIRPVSNIQQCTHTHIITDDIKPKGLVDIQKKDSLYAWINIPTSDLGY